MFYCKNCHNFLNISKTITQNRAQSHTVGGKAAAIGDDIGEDGEDANATSDLDVDNASVSEGTGESQAYFVCNSCGYYKPIVAGTLLYTKQYDESNDDEFDDYHLLIYDNTLPRTYKYICQNKKCETHKNPDSKEAVIYKNNKYKVLYVCTVCEEYWFVNHLDHLDRNTD
jgi:RNase P subunit RPR2